MTNVFIVSELDDTGGVAAGIVRAFARHGGPDWNVTSMRGSNNYIDYPETFSWDIELFKQLYNSAHLIHGMERLINVERAIGHKLDRPAVMHHHGTEFRDRPSTYGDWCRDRKIPMVCSTVDLVASYPGTKWMPSPIPIEWLQLFRSQYRPIDTGSNIARARSFYVGHHPTQRHMKGTDTFLAALAGLEGIEPMFIEYQPWSVSLSAKAKCDAYFDQLLFGFGLSALEAWAMGLPVMAGVRNQTIIDAMIAHWGRLPFIEVHSAADITAASMRLARDPLYRSNWGEIGLDYVREFHDERVVVERLKALWTKTIDRFRP